MMTRRGYGWMAALVLIGWCLAPRQAWAWGRDGHSIVGKIAELRLTAKAKQVLQEQITDISLGNVDISSWPDTITKNPHFAGVFPNNSLWHYVDIPYDATEYDPIREGKAAADKLGKDFADVGTENNVIEQISIWQGVLADKQAPGFKRKTALRFVVHFLGDIHQPLHCATRGDGGGNAVPVLYLGTFDHHVHLHQVWDDNLVDAARQGTEPLIYAFQLHQKITDDQKKAWETVTVPKDWAKESHQLAKDYAYPPVLEQGWNGNPNGPPVRLDMDYVKKATPVVEQQLMKAGVRLAKILNDALDPAP
jgi:hypothetical protein